MESIRELRKICQRSKKESDNSYGRIFARPISIYLTKLFLFTPISANQLTLVSGLLGVIAGVFFVIGGHWNGILGAAFLHLSFIFDYVDGEVARYKKQSSPKGEFLDGVILDFIHVFIFICLTFRAFNTNVYILNRSLYHNPFIFIFGFTSVCFPLMCKALATNWKVIHKQYEIKLLAEDRGRDIHLLRLFSSPFVYPGIMNVITIGAVLNILHFVLIGYGLLFPLFWFGIIIWLVNIRK